MAARKKKAATAVRTAEVPEHDNAPDGFTDLAVAPDPAEEEPEEPEPEPEPEPAPEPEPEPEPGPEPEPEKEEEEVAAAEEDPEPEEKKAPGIPPSALAELKKLRRERRDRQREDRQMPQVPAPVAATDPIAPGTPAGIPLNRLPVKFDDDGQPYLDVSELQGAVGPPPGPPPMSPQQVVAQEFETARTAWIAEDPMRHAPAAKRAFDAAEWLDLKSEEMVLDLGGVAPKGLKAWETALEESGVADELREHWPEIGDLKRFSHAIYSGDIEALRLYMDDYVDDLYADDGGEAPRPSPSPKSKVVPLPKGRPRSMAKKGSSSPDEGDNQARYDRLNRAAMSDPMSFAEGDQAEMDRLARKLGILD